MVVGLIRAMFPFIDCPAATFGPDAVFGDEMLGKQAVRFGFLAEKGE